MLPERRGDLAHVGQGVCSSAPSGRTPTARTWLAGAKPECENDETARARLLLEKACGSAPSAKVRMKLALLERECDGGADEVPTSTLDDAIAKNPTSASSE